MYYSPYRSWESTLADRILEYTGAIDKNSSVAQVLDDMEVERQRGITVKSRSVSVHYKDKSGKDWIINLIDTPGHVDFRYEVSRSLSACEGALLVVDAAQGVQAQTVANVYTAIEHDLEIVPVLNKIDLPTADVDRVCLEIEEIIGLDAGDAAKVSGKTGEGVGDLLEMVVRKIPAAEDRSDSSLRALIFDSWFDSYQGVVIQVRVVDGTIKKRDKIVLMQTGAEYEVTALGIFSPTSEQRPELKSGMVGWVAASIKNISDAKIGDTITHKLEPAVGALSGFAEIKPMVFSGLYPSDSGDYEILRDALSKLKLNDAAFFFEPETSTALGFGFRCGYLGMLHMEIIQQRLESEYGLDLVTTAPSVVYKLTLKTGEVIEVDNPAKFPDRGDIGLIEEPIVTGTVHTFQEHLGGVLSLCEEKRGIQKSLNFHSGDRVTVVYELPLNEIVIDFYDKLKSVSRGYASFDYDISGERESDLVKLDLKINGDPVDALSVILHKDRAFYYGQKLAEKMKELIDRQMFDIAIQAVVSGRVIARSTIKALRKNVTAKCYGGDITRKRKLLEKQKAGKKRMKQVGAVQISQEAFLAALKLDSD